MINKKIYCLAAALAILGAAASCKKAIEIPGGSESRYSMVYLPAAATNLNTYILRMTDSVQQIALGATLGGTGQAEKDIQVQYQVDQKMADAYNAAKGTTYPILPAGAYEMPASTVIPKGQLSSPLVHIKINPSKGLELFKQYLLPVTIQSISDGVQLNQNLRTAYYLVSASLNLNDFTEFSRDKWTILSYDSQEPAEGQPNGGLALNAIDNNTASFWHSKWNGGETPMPHWLAVDLGETKTLHGITLIGRQSDNKGKPKDITVAVSTNGTDWEDVGQVTGKDTNDKQKYFVTTFREARYFRITVTSGYGDTRYTHLAELGAF
ncbi:BT_3987 domain-containing protein [Mucilaginibacter angelicae]|uniref:BT_3987 domain-containing protein n=1 Tax=Mucilaginibacter angelicae TaxID=869718 RepID=A0ABV6L0Y4_9SPHI